MMFALILASITTGQMVTRLGRYKTIGVVGMSVTTAGMFLLSRMGISTSYTLVMINMMVVGVGLGMTLPVFNLAVQNAVDVAQVGVATSFGSAFQEALPRDVASRIPAATLAAFANPQTLMDPEVASRMNADPVMLEQMRPVLAAVQTSLSVSIHDVFLMGTIIAAVGIVFAQLVIDVPLRQSNASRAPAVEGV